MHPWEFYRYDMGDFVTKVLAERKRMEYQSRDEWERVRSLAFVTAKSSGSLKSKKIDQFWPFPWDKNRVSSISALPKEQQLEAIRKRSEEANKVFTQFMQMPKEFRDAAIKKTKQQLNG
jgi:hypothetical protein